MSPSGQWFQRRDQWPCFQHFGRLFPELFLGQGLLFELVKSLEYVFLGSVCEEHIDDLSQFATSSSRIQQLRDAARIGKEVRDGTAKLGLTLSCKSTLLANDKSLGMLIVAHLVADGVPMCQGTAATDLGIETAAGNRRCASNQWKRIWKGRRRAKRVYRLCRMNPAAQILTMTGIHPFQVHGHTAKHDVQKFENGQKLVRVLFPQSLDSSGQSGCHKWPPELSKSASGSRCGAGPTRTQDAEFANSGQKLPLFWRMILVAGMKQRVQSLPPSARFWKRTGCQARQVSGSRQTPALPSMVLCSTRHKLSTVSPDTWRCKCGNKLVTRSVLAWKKGIITDVAKEARNQLVREKSFISVRALDFLVCGAIDEPHLLADGSIPNQFLCVRCDQRTLATRKHELCNNLINHTHMQKSDHLVKLAQ